MADLNRAATNHVAIIIDIDLGLCTPACAAATTAAACHCACRGKNHGAVWLVDPIETREGEKAATR